MKSEPLSYSIDDLKRDQETGWDGVRNYQARNYMRDQMRIGDLALFYHSNANPPGVVGLMRVVEVACVDPTQFDENDHHYDPKSAPEAPRWFMPKVAFVERFNKLVSLEQLKADRQLEGLRVTKKGQRLSVMPVDKRDMQRVLKLAGARTKIS